METASRSDCRAGMAPDSVGDWPANREGIGARIRSRFVRWNGEKKLLFKWLDFRAAISRRSCVKQPLNAESLHRDDGPASTEVQQTSSSPQQLANPLSSHSPKPLPQGRTIFPGSSTSDAAHSQSKPWDESEWID
jgi:hypothetical protein